MSLIGKFGLVRSVVRKAGKAEEKAEMVLVCCRGQNQNRAGTEYGGDFAAAGCCLTGSCLSAVQEGWLDFRVPP